jgi:hypothetical protein
MLNALEQKLYDLARAALPSWLFTDEANAQELIRAAAAQLSDAWEQVDFWLDQTYLTRGVDIFVDQHAKDHGTRRQNGETTASLVSRLRNTEDAVTIPALLSHIIQVMHDNGAPSSPPPVILEMRYDKLYLGRHIHITPTAGANLVDGETFTLGSTIFEFDSNGAVVGGHIAVPFTMADNLHTVALSILSAVIGAGFNIGIDEVDHLYVSGVTSYGETVGNASFKMQIESLGYLSRGWRVSKTNEPTMTVILPFGTSANLAAIVAETMRQFKAGGVVVYVETRLVP